MGHRVQIFLDQAGRIRTRTERIPRPPLRLCVRTIGFGGIPDNRAKHTEEPQLPGERVGCDVLVGAWIGRWGKGIPERIDHGSGRAAARAARRRVHVAIGPTIEVPEDAVPRAIGQHYGSLSRTFILKPLLPELERKRLVLDDRTAVTE